MKKIIWKLALVFIAVFMVGGCSSGETTTNAPPLAANEEATSDPYIVIHKEQPEVAVYAEVNGTYFTEPTRHGVVFADGSNGAKSVLRSLGDEKVFYEAMMTAGFVPGNNLTIEDMSKGIKVAGDALNVFVAWDDQEIPLADAIRASEERPMDIRFGGNIENAKDKNTGCILCLDSCAVGITSNAAYETGAFDNDNIEFFGKADVLPADGTMVKVIFRAR